MYPEEKELLRKLDLKIPNEHKYLSYVSKSLDLILFYDKPEAFQHFLNKYPHVSIDTTLKACLEHGASDCFTHFFNTTRSPSYYFNKLFDKPEIPALGQQCAYYYIKNNKMLNTMEEVCATFFPGKTTSDFLTDQEQIEYCTAKFGIKGRLKLAKKLLDKLENPLFMVNNMSVFDAIYANKADEFGKIYLEHIEDKKLVNPFILSLFSKPNIKTHSKFINLFDRFTHEGTNGHSIHTILNNYLVKNIKNGNISVNYQELMMAYCIHNGNINLFNAYNDTRPIVKQNILIAIKEPWKFQDTMNEIYRHFSNATNKEVYLENNAFKLFHSNERLVNQWYQTVKELNNTELYSSVSSLFCLGKTDEYNNCPHFGNAITNLSNHIDWETKDQNGNNFSHYLTAFFNKMIKFHPNGSNGKALFTVLDYLKNNKLETLISVNNAKIMSGEEFLTLIPQSLTYTKNVTSEQQRYIDDIQKILNYGLLNEELGHNQPSSTKRLKL